jgi:hypothetical protein
LIIKHININYIKIITIIAAGIFFYSCNKDVSVTPPDSLPPNGYIFLDSNPEGFQIYLNNKPTGRITPDSIKWLSSGDYNIILKKDLFNDYSFNVHVVEGVKSSIFIDFSNITGMAGSISCLTTPVNAEIFLNGSNTGHVTPYTLTNILPGMYYVKFHLKNHRDDSVLVSVSSASNALASKYLIDTTLWQDYTPANSAIPFTGLTCIAVDKNNIVYAGSAANGCLSFDGQNWKTYSNSLGLQINCMVVDKNNNILYGTPRGFVAFDGRIRTEYGFKSSGLTDFHVQALAVDNNNNWFIGTQAGLTEAVPSAGQINWVNYSLGSDYNYTQTTFVMAAAADNAENVWLGLYNNGIAVKDKLNNWTYYSTYNSILQSKNVTVIAAGPTGEVWIGYGIDNNYGHGLTLIEGSSWSNYNPTPDNSKTTAIFIDGKNVKWVGTDMGLVEFSSPDSKTIFNNNNTGLNLSGITGIAGDSYGNIWLSTDSGLYEYKGNH